MGRRVGLLGGSFNPAHSGHVHISLEALKRLHLTEVWWLVSPQNPLKPAKGMASFKQRLTQARLGIRHPRIKVSDLEMRINTRYSVDTLKKLRQRFRGTRFVWIIGADNLVQMSHWRHWRQIFQQVPVAVFDRATYAHAALASRAATVFRAARRPVGEASKLAYRALPAWCFFALARHPASATAIRSQRRLLP